MELAQNSMYSSPTDTVEMLAAADLMEVVEEQKVRPSF